MRQTTLPEQTAKLIELGVEKPKGSHIYWQGNELVININYSIGELFEMLPEIHPSYHDPYCLDIGFDTIMWIVGYSYNSGYVEVVSSCELIDALYDMVIKLKEDGNI